MPQNVQEQKRKGRKGGLRTAQRHGPDFYESIGSLGGQALILRYGKNYMRALVMKRYEKKNG